jgi:hypothetical protein
VNVIVRRLQGRLAATILLHALLGALQLFCRDRAQVAGRNGHGCDDIVLAERFRVQLLLIEIQLCAAGDQAGVERQQLFAVQLVIERVQDA